MSTEEDDVRLSEIEAFVETVLPDWLKHVWQVHTSDDQHAAVLENAFRGLYENTAGLLADLRRLGDWTDYESYAIMKGYFVSGIVRHWRRIVHTSDLVPVFEDSDLIVCPYCHQQQNT